MSLSRAKWVKQPEMNSHPQLSYGDTRKPLFGEKSSSHFYMRLCVQIFNLTITLDSTQIFQAGLLICYIDMYSLNDLKKLNCCRHKNQNKVLAMQNGTQ